MIYDIQMRLYEFGEFYKMFSGAMRQIEKAE